MEKIILETLRGQLLLDFFRDNIQTLAPEFQALVFFGLGFFTVIGVFSFIIGLIKLMRR